MTNASAINPADSLESRTEQLFLLQQEHDDAVRAGTLTFDDRIDYPPMFTQLRIEVTERAAAQQLTDEERHLMAERLLNPFTPLGEIEFIGRLVNYAHEQKQGDHL